jgi:hypothetical protein
MVLQNTGAGPGIHPGRAGVGRDNRERNELNSIARSAMIPAKSLPGESCLKGGKGLTSIPS